MKTLLFDTNIYGLALERKEVMETLLSLANEKQKSDKRYFVLGSEIVRDELDAIPKKEIRERLNELYQIVISGEIKLTDRIKSLATEYFNECKRNRVKITIEDCQIVASSCVANVNFIITDNRRTMMNPKAINSFTLISKKRGLRMPEFMGYETLKSFLSSSGIP